MERKGISGQIKVRRKSAGMKTVEGVMMAEKT